ncbi:MAG: MOSC domain-containing protein [Pseudomonadota bacterium]
MRLQLEAICTGTARPFNGAETSAIAKRPRDGVVQILEDGFAPDEQADRRVHGGPEKAVHLYPLDHHEFWRGELSDTAALALLDQPGAFGSNLAVSDVSEEHVHIGDRFRIGTALLEISQPRQPCWKVDHRFGVKGMTATIVRSGRCGWYFRVLENGDCKAGDRFERVDTGHTDWSVARTFNALIAGKGTREEYSELTELDRLTPAMRTRAAQKAD